MLEQWVDYLGVRVHKFCVGVHWQQASVRVRDDLQEGCPAPQWAVKLGLQHGDITDGNVALAQVLLNCFLTVSPRSRLCHPDCPPATTQSLTLVPSRRKWSRALISSSSTDDFSVVIMPAWINRSSAVRFSLPTHAANEPFVPPSRMLPLRR